jgi:hypothetical protein
MSSNWSFQNEIRINAIAGSVILIYFIYSLWKSGVNTMVMPHHELTLGVSVLWQFKLVSWRKEKHCIVCGIYFLGRKRNLIVNLSTHFRLMTKFKMCDDLPTRLPPPPPPPKRLHDSVLTHRLNSTLTFLTLSFMCSNEKVYSSQHFRYILAWIISERDLESNLFRGWPEVEYTSESLPRVKIL